jgi:N-acyl-D-amino-acid deacylase
MLREEAFDYRWRSMGEFLDAMNSQGVLLNIAMLVGHGTLRYATMGDHPGHPAPKEQEALCHGVRQAIQEGAFGLSAGLGYVPGMYANNDELLALMRTTAQEGGIYAVHNRTYRWMSLFYEPLTGGMPHNIRSIREQLDLARQAQAKLQFSHLIFVGRNTWHTHRTALDDIEQAAENGLDVAFDAFPYTFGNTTINVNFPKWFLVDLEENLHNPAALDQLRAELDSHAEMVGRGYDDIYLLWAGKPELAHLEGADFVTIADRLRTSPFEAYVSVARDSGLKARILQDTFSGDAESEESLQAVLSHPLCSFMLDTVLTRKGTPNPASRGTFPRILGKYSRDLGLFSLEEAVRRMTSFSAERIGLQDIGRVGEGLWADLVLFDPQTVADNTTLQSPYAAPTGIKSVLISGQVVAQDGRLVNEDRHGRVLRR